MKRGWPVQATAVALALVLGIAAQPVLAPWLAHAVRADDRGAFSAVQKQELQKLVHDYLIEHPEVVADAINALQAKEDKAKEDKQTAAVRAHRKDLFDDTDGTVIGNPKGDVALVEFFDNICGYCKAMFPAMMDTLKQDGKVRLVLKEFPILGPSSITASRAALAARKQNKYGVLHLALLGHKGALTDAMVFAIAKDAGLDVDKLRKDMDDPAIAAIITKNHRLAQALDIEGTPAMVIGDTLVPGAVGKARLVELVDHARKGA